VAADDDLPRGWTYSDLVDGAAASITVPGIAGIAHVLDAFQASIAGNATYVGQVTLTSTSGTFTTFSLGLLTSASGSSLGLAMMPGEGFTIAIDNSPGAGGNSSLLIQGHDN
jgi:hypothetical protein